MAIKKLTKEALKKANKKAKKVIEVKEAKRGRGRPPGVKNKPKPAATVSASPGRTPGAKIRKEQIEKRKVRQTNNKSGAIVGVSRTPGAKIRKEQIEKRKVRQTGSITKAKPTGLTRASFTGGYPSAGLRNKSLSKVPTAMKVAALGPLAGLTTLAITGRKKPKSAEAAKVTFGEAFKAARKKGEGTKFTYEGKSYTAVTKDDLKKKGYDANELKQYANRKGKARGPLRRAGQGIKKVLLGKDKKFGGDKGLIDFVRKPKKKVTPKKKMGGGMANASAPKKYRAGGMATKGLGKAYMKSKR